LWGTAAKSPQLLFPMRIKVACRSPMTEETQRALADLQAIVADTGDQTEREGLLRIVARLRPHSDDWPDDDELFRIRMEYLGAAG
jgi:hypothetical protein